MLLFQESKNATETQKHICAVCGEGAVTDRTCQKWFMTFWADFLMDNAPRSGKPVEIDSDQIEKLIENNPCYTMQETANPNIQISKSTVIGENEKNVSLTEKNIRTFWPTQLRTTGSKQRVC